MPYADPEKRKTHRREYYLRTKKQTQEYYKENKDRFAETNKKIRARNRKIINEIKVKSGCSRCGWNEHPSALEYHHLDPSAKKLAVARFVNFSYGIETILQEIDKCTLLCANCHRIVHAKGNVAESADAPDSKSGSR